MVICARPADSRGGFLLSALAPFLGRFLPDFIPGSCPPEPGFFFRTHMSIVHDFPSIARKLNRQDQKAEFEAKNPVSSFSEPNAATVAAMEELERGGGEILEGPHGAAAVPFVDFQLSAGSIEKIREYFSVKI